MPGSEIKTVDTIVATVGLSQTYVASTLFVLRPDHNYFDLELTITHGNAGSVEYQQQVSNDGGTTWFTPMVETIAASGTATAAKLFGTIALGPLTFPTETVIIPFLRESYGNYRFLFKSTAAGGVVLTATVRKFGNRPPAWHLKFGAGSGSAAASTGGSTYVLDPDDGTPTRVLSEATGREMLATLQDKGEGTKLLNPLGEQINPMDVATGRDIVAAVQAIPPPLPAPPIVFPPAPAVQAVLPLDPRDGSPAVRATEATLREAVAQLQAGLMLVNALGEQILPMQDATGKDLLAAILQPNATLPTYRASFSVAAGAAGDVIELRGVVGRVARVTRVSIIKPSVVASINVAKRSTQDTGGTIVAQTVIPLDSAFPGALLTVNGYTAAPTQGAAVGNVWPVTSMGTSDVNNLTYGDVPPAGPIVIRAGEALAIVTSIAVTLVGYVEWTEGPA